MKLNFFSRVYLAITDFRLYPYVVQKEKFVTAFAYFLCFMILVSIVLSANASFKVLNWMKEFSSVYNDQISNYVIRNGELSVKENMDIDFSKVKIYTDDTKKIDRENLNLKDSNNYRFVILAYKDAAAVGNNSFGYVIFNYNELGININKEILYNVINMSLNSLLFKLSLVGIIFCGVFASYLITRFFYVLLITLMLLFLGFVFRTQYKFKDYMKVAFYVITLPTITEIIALIVIGELNEYANITYYLLSYVYMFYAIRALKLDNIIISTQEKIMNMKSESEKANDLLSEEKMKKNEQVKDENQTNNDEDNNENNKQE